MKSRPLLYLFVLAAYMLSLAHSVIPHHHHKTFKEAQAHSGKHHHHKGKGHHHHKHGENSKHESDGTTHLFFFNHDSNADVLVRQASLDRSVKSKKADIPVEFKKQIISFEISEYLVFHPPQDDEIFITALPTSNSLRAPPSFLI
jgi:hypothetical protein